MSRNTCRMIGLIVIMISVFLIMGGLFLKGSDSPFSISPVCLIAGIMMLIVGTVFYKILKSE